MLLARQHARSLRWRPKWKRSHYERAFGKARLAAGPVDPDAWVRAPEPSNAAERAGDIYTARLTIDVTPALRGRIKITAFHCGQTVANMLRDLLAREFPEHDGTPS